MALRSAYDIVQAGELRVRRPTLKDAPLPTAAATDDYLFRPTDDPSLSLGNPLYSLTPQRAASMFEAAMQGEMTEIQWLFEWISRLDADVIALLDRRMTAISQLDWRIRIPSELSDEDKALAEAQAEALQQVYDAIDNLPLVIAHLAGAAFRGYAHCYVRSVSDIEILDQWYFIRCGLNGPWYWNPDAMQTNYRALRGSEIRPKDWLIFERPNNLLFLAVLKYLRTIWNERYWDKFCEAAAKLGTIIIGPPGMSQAQVAGFKADALGIAKGGSGVLPSGSTVNSTNATRGPVPFEARLDHLSEKLVLAATGGILTSLAAPTGMGSGVAEQQGQVFGTIARSDAHQIAAVFQHRIDRAVLRQHFRGQRQLAYFDLSDDDDAKSSSEVFADAASAVTAGYRIAQHQLEELTGYRLVPAPAPGAGMGFSSFGASAQPTQAAASSPAPAAPEEPQRPAVAPPAPAEHVAAANERIGVMGCTPIENDAHGSEESLAAPAQVQPAPTEAPESWAAPLADAVNAWLQAAEDGATVEQLQEQLDALSNVLEDMDSDALAEQLAEHMTQAAAAAIAAEIDAKPELAHLAKSDNRPVKNSAPSVLARWVQKILPIANAEGGVEIAPLSRAVAKFLGKEVTPSAFGTAEWDQVAADIKDRAFFSARIESASLLQTMKNKLAQALQLHRKALHGAPQGPTEPAGMDRSAFVREMRDELAQDGYNLAQGSQDLRDITSQRRLRLIFDHNAEAAAEAARYQIHQDPDVLDAYPVRELIRIEGRQVPRDWQQRWRAAGGMLYAGGRMVAPINSDIWVKISRFGQPYPPFDFNSGMGVIDLPRDEAERLGALPATQKPRAAGLNAGLSAGLTGMDANTLKALQTALGGNYSVSGGRIGRAS